MNKDFSLQTTQGNILNITANGLNNLNSGPCLIFVHGFRGFKDWGFYPFVSNYFAKKGYFILTFNFSHNGIGESKTDFSELDKFAENTVSLEISELNDLLNAYNAGFFGNVQVNRIALIGHSRGGAVCLLSSHINNTPSIYVVWASVAVLDRYTDRQKKEWKEKGFIEVLNSRTKQMMRLNVNLLDDIERNRNNSLNIENAVRNLSKPLLIVHGYGDLTVPPNEADMIYNWSNKNETELFKIQNTGHTFGVVHPFESSTLAFAKLLDKTESFLLDKLNGIK
jgi:pimeloyl-ACP methyl ester carboxylesterase